MACGVRPACAARFRVGVADLSPAGACARWHGSARRHERAAAGVQRAADPGGHATRTGRHATRPAACCSACPRAAGGPARIAATRYILRIRTNVILIVASAGGYFFLSGVQTFGVEFVTRQYAIDQALGTLVLLVVGIGGVIGVLAGGALGDLLLRRGVFTGRILVSAIAAATAVVLFVPAIFTHHATMALPYIVFAALALSAQNPPLDAARLDIMVPLLWGRAEGIRTFLRTFAQAAAPVIFGGVSDYVFGGGRSGSGVRIVLVLLIMLGLGFEVGRPARG